MTQLIRERLPVRWKRQFWAFRVWHLVLLSTEITILPNLQKSPRQMTEKAIKEGLPEGTLLNINVPKGVPKGIRVTKQGFKNARPMISEHIDPRGKLYYWIGEERSGFHAEGGTDFEAIDEGFVSVTPMRSDLTNHKAIEILQNWNESSV